MPLNTLRLNHQKSSHPNDRVVFIKPLPRPPSQQAGYEIADTFLRAIAAQCLPLMKKHYLSVTTLEEHEPNPEFIGRNFNNGEIIQLVLRTKQGKWVPFPAVQMVMMHELAHNTHMNHGKDFWKARNSYAEDMKALWAKGYTGEGFWGSGRTLNDMSAVMGNNILTSTELESLPLCGGTYRSRNRKRRGRTDKPELTWKEKRDRRIEKKFGTNGVALGEDEDKRLALEINRRGPIGGKPRVAQSARGRELRAAAALARFDTNKREVDLLLEAGKNDDSDDEDDYEDLDAGLEDARDATGRKILDGRGHGMIRVCEDEGLNGADRQHEIHEMHTLERYFNSFRLGHEGYESTGMRAGQATPAGKSATPPHRTERELSSDTSKSNQSPRASPGKQQPRASTPAAQSAVPSQLPFSGSSFGKNDAQSARNLRKTRKTTPASPDTNVGKPTSMSLTPAKSASSSPRPATTPVPDSTVRSPRPTTICCPICSLENPRLNATCLACCHVMDSRKDPRAWSCQSEACRSSGTGYLNAGDVGICGVCGVRRAG
ncbi:hypothetical protein H2200_006971 [Cladophialophora chaetospira]|uniref:WLM domain-containing protein n=1 Tax=Cladophialophora chaetospira TaxID=386627 RepID=A0AA38X9D7_9EURO|nr:hypothetical protein H2200_006971 [Cladophialophora chaetospira]